MNEPPGSKTTTRNIQISEPDGERLQEHLAGRHVSPELERFLKNMTNGRKWTRKINIPSTHDNLAAVLVFASEFKERGLEITSELHVFFENRIVVEKWTVKGEGEETACVSQGMLRSVEIEKVRLEGRQVRVVLSLSLPDGESKRAVETFDFSEGTPNHRQVPNPFL